VRSDLFEPRIFEPRSARFRERVEKGVAGQAVLRGWGAVLERVVPGEVDFALAFDPGLTQQHGFVHGGIVGAMLDSACGFAALSLMDDDSAVLTVEYKVNFLAPAQGGRFLFGGRVIKPGRTLTLAEGMAQAFPDSAGEGKLIATISCTLMAVRGRDLDG